MFAKDLEQMAAEAEGPGGLLRESSADPASPRAPKRAEIRDDESARAQAALVALLRVLLPEGERRYLRDCGIATLPLAPLNAVLAPLGYVLVGTKTRSAARFVRCINAHGQVERFGLFELRRVEAHV